MGEWLLNISQNGKIAVGVDLKSKVPEAAEPCGQEPKPCRQRRLRAEFDAPWKVGPLLGPPHKLPLVRSHLSPTAIKHCLGQQ